MTQMLGWVATAAFCSSYLVPRRFLLGVQVVAAFLWIGYGLLSSAAPVVVANAIVASAAGFSIWRERHRLPGASAGANR